MRAVHYVLATAEEQYLNEEELKSGLTLVTNTTIESVEHINREMTVLSAPKGTILEKGDKIIVHHNILRKQNGPRGIVMDSNYKIQDNIYFVPPTEIFLLKKPGGEWQALDPYVFVEPIETKDKAVGSLIVKDFTKYKQHVGKLAYVNQQLSEWGLQKGDTVAFARDSEHEYPRLDDYKVLYKMRTPDVLMHIDGGIK